MQLCHLTPLVFPYAFCLCFFFLSFVNLCSTFTLFSFCVMLLWFLLFLVLIRFLGTYVDKKCPFTSDVSIRGRILTGVVHSTKMKRTIIVRRNYLHYIPKYSRYEKRHTNVPAHCSPAFSVKEGDMVTIGQCRPLSKTVRFNVIKVEAQKRVKKQFAAF